jgi:hypothetical protein
VKQIHFPRNNDFIKNFHNDININSHVSEAITPMNCREELEEEKREI